MEQKAKLSATLCHKMCQKGEKSKNFSYFLVVLTGKVYD